MGRDVDVKLSPEELQSLGRKVSPAGGLPGLAHVGAALKEEHTHAVHRGLRQTCLLM